MQNQLLEIEQEVFTRRPILKEIAGKFSDISLKDYVQKHWAVPDRAPDRIFLDVLKTEAKEIYNPAIAEALVGQLLKTPLVSTIDHLGIWNHPIFVNSDLIYSLHFGQEELMPILATESVSLNNTSSWSASLLWHEGNSLERRSFLPDKFKTLPVYSAPRIKANDIDRFKAFTQGRFDELIKILDFAGTSSGYNFSVQACQASYKFWQAVFPSAPKAVYLPLETIVAKYLLKVLENEADVLSQLVLTKPGRELWAKYFKDEHTFMFWGIDAKGRRQAIKALPKNLLELIQKRKLYPSSPLCFAVLLKAGLACVGGFTQTTWLSEVKEKLKALLLEMNTDGYEVEGIPTKNFAESSLAWLEHDGQYIMPTAVDLYLTGQDYYNKYLKLAEQLSLGQSLQLAMPTIYSVVVAQAGQGEFDLNNFQKLAFKNSGAEELLKGLEI